MNKEFSIVQPACVTLVLDNDRSRSYMHLENPSITMDKPTYPEIAVVTISKDDVTHSSSTKSDLTKLRPITTELEQQSRTPMKLTIDTEETEMTVHSTSSVTTVRSRKGTRSEGSEISPSASKVGLTPERGLTVPTSSESTTKAPVRLTRSFPEDDKKEEKTDILEEFEEQAKFFQQQYLMVQKPVKHRSPSPSSSPQKVGLDHLDNLVKLMEQLSQLKEENSSLKKRCAYLESAKSLLQARSQMTDDSDISLPQLKPRLYSDSGSWKRNASMEGNTINGGESSEHRNLTIKRSFSTGSINLPELVIDEMETEPTSYQEAPFYKNSKHKKSSKWARVKKVLKGQKSEESHLTVPDESLHSPDYLSAPKMNISESRSMDSGVGSGPEGHDNFRLSLSPVDLQRPIKEIYSEDKSHKSEDDLCTEIWMGPPGWESSTTSHDEEFITKDSVNTFLAPIHRSRDEDSLNAQYLEIANELPRRSSSPSFTCFEDEKCALHDDKGTNVANIHRSSSSKSDGIGDVDYSGKTVNGEKKSKTAWGRVKEIITHKDSVKKRHRKLEKTESDNVEGGMFVSESSTELSPQGSTKRTTHGSPKKSVRCKKSEDSQSIPVVVVEPSSSTNVDISRLMGSISDDFTKKMAEWESKKHKKYVVNQSEPSSFSTTDSTEFPESTRTKVTAMEEMMKTSSSFTRKLQAWEKMKSQKISSPILERRFRSFKRDDQKSKKSKPEREKERCERQRERDYHKVEREQQKLDREKQRLNKERLRALEREAKIEKMKERLSTSTESTLFNPILKPLSEYKVTSDFAQKLHEWEVIKGMSQEASTALYLEVQKRSMELAMEMYGDTSFMKHTRRSSHRRRKVPVCDDTLDSTNSLCDGKDGDLLSDITEQSNSESYRENHRYSVSEPTSPVVKTFPGGMSDESTMDDTLDDIDVITSSIASMEKANIRLVEQLCQKKDAYLSTQLEVRALSEKLSNMKTYHYKALAEYETELGKEEAHGNVSINTTVTSKTLLELESKIRELQNFGEQMSLSMEGTMMCKFQSIEGEESVGARLMDLVRQMKMLLMKTPQSEASAQYAPMQEDFRHLYSQAMQLQIQMNNLRLSKLERNKEILDMKRQLLLQEVTNLLLQVDITRREAELLRYKAVRHKTLKRSNTYNGHDTIIRNSDDYDRDCKGDKHTMERRYSVDLLPLFEAQHQTGDYYSKSVEFLAEVPSSQHVCLSAPKLPRDSTTSADSTEMSSAKSCDSETAMDDSFVKTKRRFRASETQNVKQKRNLSLPASCEDSLDDILAISEQTDPRQALSTKSPFKQFSQDTDSGFKSDSSPKFTESHACDFSLMQGKNSSLEEEVFEHKEGIERKSDKVVFRLGASESVHSMENMKDDSQENIRQHDLDAERGGSSSACFPLLLPSSPVTRHRNKRLRNMSAQIAPHKVSDDFLRLKDTPPRSHHFTKHLCKQKKVDDIGLSDKCTSENALMSDNSLSFDNEQLSHGAVGSHEIQSLDPIHPTPTLNLAHVGLISPVKSLKPASELMQDSRQRRHRIMSFPQHVNKSCEVLSPRTSSETGSVSDSMGKENINADVGRDSHETRPDSYTQEPHGHYTTAMVHGSRKGSINVDQHTIQSLQEKPLKDLTNGNGGDVNNSPKGISISSSPVPVSKDIGDDDELITHEKIPNLITSSPIITQKIKKETPMPKATPYSSHSLFHRRKKHKPTGVKFDEGAFSDSEVKPTKYSKRAGKVMKSRPKSMEVPSDQPMSEQPKSPVLKRSFFHKVGRQRSNSEHVPLSPGAVSTLCEQSMTFDLGVTSTARSNTLESPRSSVNTPPSSPRSSRQRSNFLDAALQRSKRLFKVSK